MTMAVPDASSFAAWPNPWPSMWAPMIYISSGWVAPTLVQNTSERSPLVGSSRFSRRSVSSIWANGSRTTPVAEDRAAARARAVATHRAAGGSRAGGVHWRTCPADPTRSPTRFRLDVINDPFGARATDRLKPRLDPGHGVSIPRSALATVAELGEPLDRGLVLREVQPANKGSDKRAALISRLCLCHGRGHHAEDQDDQPPHGPDAGLVGVSESMKCADQA